jgi:hypothetical protein
MQTAAKPVTVKWFSNRIKSGRKRASPQQIAALRMHDFDKLFRSRYGGPLPDDDSGRDDIEPVIHHIASLPQPGRRAAAWLEHWAPWLTLWEQRKIISEGIASAKAWKADALAWRYRVTNQERTLIGLTTIGAIDHGKAARTKRRRQRERERRQCDRRKAGSLPRAEYLAASISRSKPWEAQGISRATWYRRQRETTAPHAPSRETTPPTA